MRCIFKIQNCSHSVRILSALITPHLKTGEIDYYQKGAKFSSLIGKEYKSFEAT